MLASWYLYFTLIRVLEVALRIKIRTPVSSVYPDQIHTRLAVFGLLALTLGVVAMALAFAGLA
jgi:hypothetical protein